MPNLGPKSALESALTRTSARWVAAQFAEHHLAGERVPLGTTSPDGSSPLVTDLRSLQTMSAGCALR